MREFVLSHDREKFGGYASFRCEADAMAYHDHNMTLQRQITGAAVYRVDCFDGTRFLFNVVTDEICNGELKRREGKGAPL